MITRERLEEIRNLQDHLNAMATGRVDGIFPVMECVLSSDTVQEAANALAELIAAVDP